MKAKSFGRGVVRSLKSSQLLIGGHLRAVLLTRSARRRTEESCMRVVTRAGEEMKAARLRPREARKGEEREERTRQARSVVEVWV